MPLMNVLYAHTEGASEYTTCSGLLTSSSATWPKTALFQIIASGVSSSKLVIGKPGSIVDATTGYVSPSQLASCVSEAKGKGWSAFNLSFFFSFLGNLGHDTDKRIVSTLQRVAS